MLEPDASKGARPVLRGGGGGDLTSLPDYGKARAGCAGSIMSSDWSPTAPSLRAPHSEEQIDRCRPNLVIEVKGEKGKDAGDVAPGRTA